MVSTWTFFSHEILFEKLQILVIFKTIPTKRKTSLSLISYPWKGFTVEQFFDEHLYLQNTFH